MEICRLRISLLVVVSSVSIQDPGWNSTESAREGKEHRAAGSAYQDELCPVAGRELGKDKGCAQDHTSVVMAWPLSCFGTQHSENTSPRWSTGEVQELVSAVG